MNLSDILIIVSIIFGLASTWFASKFEDDDMSWQVFKTCWFVVIGSILLTVNILGDPEWIYSWW